MKAEYFLSDKTEFNVDTIDQPLITVVMPTFQRARSGMLDRALSAVFNQTFKNFELIIIDDGSEDGTDRIIKGWLKKDKRVRLIRHEKNSGLPALRADEGILTARGKYIAFAFDDDLWYENALDDLYAAIISDDAIDAVYGIDKYYIQEEDDFKLFSDSYGGRDFSVRDIKVSNFIPCNAFLIKKKSMIDVGLFAPHILMRRIADWDFWMRAGPRLKIIHRPVLCGEMYEMKESGLPRIGNVDIDLLSRFANNYNLKSASIKTYEDLVQYEIDLLPAELPHAFAMKDILEFTGMMNLYFDQRGLPRPDDFDPLISKAFDKKIKAGLFEIDRGFNPELISALSQYGSCRYISQEVPLTEILKSNLLIFDSFSTDLFKSSYPRSLRLLMNCVCLDKRKAILDNFEDIYFIDPTVCDTESVVNKIAGYFSEKRLVYIDSSKLQTMGKVLSDIINIIDHAGKKGRINRVVNHISKVIKDAQ